MIRLLTISSFLVLICLLPIRAFGVSELLMFDSDYCTWCQKWDEEIGGIYHLTAESCQAPLKKIDYDTSDLPESISIAEPVIYTPTFVLVNDQREVGRITGYPGADFFWVELNDIINSGLPENIRLANSKNCSNS